MRNLKLKLAALAFCLVAFLACRKTDIQNEAAQQAELTSVTSKAVLSDWKIIDNWASDTKENNIGYTGNITDKAIIADVVKNGLILIYAKNGSSTKSLPYTSAAENVYWYYQVSEGSIAVMGIADNKTATINKNQEFRYVILSEKQLTDFESLGKSKIDLINLSYEEAMSAFQP